jgi:hypothetical protein
MDMMLCDDGNERFLFCWVEMVEIIAYTYTYMMVNCTWTILEIVPNPLVSYQTSIVGGT